MKTTFEKGDKIFDIRFGWGVIIETYCSNWKEKNDNTLVFEVKLEDGSITYYTKRLASKLLSFKEYILKGFTQEPPINWNDYIGKWGKFWDEDSFDFIVSKLYFYNEENNAKFITSDNCPFYNFEPLTEEQIKILNLEQ